MNFKNKFNKPPKNADKIDIKMWQEILLSPKKAKEALVGLITPKGKVEIVKLANGKIVPVGEITEEQAHEFMTALCPTWAKN